MTLKLIKNAEVYAPEYLGKKDLLVGGEQILAIENNMHIDVIDVEEIDAAGKYVLPGLIDQHVHIIGGGGKFAYASMTPEVDAEELIRCGTTTVVGLLGTDSVMRTLQSLYAKVKALQTEGLSAYMLTGSFDYPPVSITNSALEDMIFVNEIIGCKTAISDERAAYVTENELLKMLRAVHVAGVTTGKGGILHIHLGAMESRMDMILDLVKNKHIPAHHLSPTHVGRTRPLFEQAIEFAKLGGMIDLSTGGTKFDEPYRQVLYALEQGVSIDQITFSSDGNASMAKDNADGSFHLYKAPVDKNLKNVIKLITDGGLSITDAFKVMTINPAKNLSLKQKGRIGVGFDADFCLFNSDFILTDVLAKGDIRMKDGTFIKKKY